MSEIRDEDSETSFVTCISCRPEENGRMVCLTNNPFVFGMVCIDLFERKKRKLKYLIISSLQDYVE